MQPPEILALSDELRGFTERAWQQLQDTQNAILDTWPQASRDARRQRLQDLKDTAARLTSQVDELALALATGGIHTAYTMGAEAGGITQYTAVDVEALGVLAQDLYDGVLAATKGVNTSTKLLIRTLAREHVGDRLLGGQTAQDAARSLRQDLEGKGVYSVTYKDGSRQGLAGYTDMLARTQSALAYNTGSINAATKAGTGWLEVFDGFGCFSGNTRVGAHGGLVAVARAWYVGPALTLTVGPDRLTVGPNHPVLTRRGWLPAHALREGDEIAHDPRRPQALGVGVDPDLVQVPPIEDVFKASSTAFGTPLRRRCRSADLHGDGSFGQGEIEVVPTRRVLLHEPDTPFAEQIRQRALVRTDADLPGLTDSGMQPTMTLRVDKASRSLVGVGHLSHAARFVEAGPLRPRAALVGAETVDPVVLGSPAERLAAPFAGVRDEVAGPGVPFLRPASFSGDSHALTGAVRRATEPGRAAAFGARWQAGKARGFEPHPFDGGAGLASQRRLVPADLSAAVAAVSWRTLDHVDPVSFEGWMYDCAASNGTLDAAGIIIKNCGWIGHSDLDKANGTIRSVEECAKVVISHPRCQRSFGFRPDVTSADEAKDAPRSQTAAQAADQQQVAEQRQARVEQRAQRLAARQAKLDQRAGVSA